LSNPEKPNDLEFCLETVASVLTDQTVVLGLRPSYVRRDVETLRRRTAVEGLGFITKSLPKLGKALDRALATDLPLDLPPSFKRKKGTFLPVFLGEVFDMIFDASTGLVRNKPSSLTEIVGAVRAVRQVCYLFYKLEGSYTTQDAEAVLDKFVETDQSLPCERDEVPLSCTAMQALESAALALWYVFKVTNLEDILPGHGPGSVATGEPVYEKMCFKRIYSHLEQEYPITDFFYLNYGHLLENFESLEAMEEIPESMAKVTLVPKDSRGPRIISMEPLEIQWIQQGQSRALVRTLERGPWTAGRVNFANQQVNRDLALDSSYPSSENDFVTLDMSEASDRVSNWLVAKLFPTHLLKKLQASRSRSTQLPDGRVVRLKKFAPMGSSVCFPVEASIFWALAVGTLRRIRRRSDMYRLPPVYVYGDDIIMRKHDYELVRPVFEELHLKFNEDKCCTGRFFRESCGMDAFMLRDVSPFRIKQCIGAKLSPQQYLAYIAYVNACGARGFWGTRAYLLGVLEKAAGPLPRVTVADSRFLPEAIVEHDWDAETCRDHNLRYFQSRYNKRLQRREVRIRRPTACSVEHGEPDWSELLRALVLGYSADCEEQPRPCCYVLPRTLNWGWGWVGTI